MMKKLCGAVALCLSVNVSAGVMDLYEIDYLATGDKLVTYDSTTGLEWLDLSYTKGNSILDTEADASIWGNGWNWASSEQIYALFSHGDSTNGELNYGIVSKLGPINTYGISGEYIGHFVAGLSRNVLEAGFARPYREIRMEGYIDLNPGRSDPIGAIGCEDEEESCATIIQPLHSETTSGDYFGSWLVRDVSATVPEPSSITLLSLGLAGLLFGRRKTKS